MDAWTSNAVLACRSCATELPSDARFCWACGIPVNSEMTSPVVELDEETALEQLRSMIVTGYTDITALHEPVKKVMRRNLRQFPYLATEPFGKERRTLLHEVALGTGVGDSTERYPADQARLDALDILLALPEIDVNARDWEGNTPLHIAISCCRQLPFGTDDFDADDQEPFMQRVQTEVITSLLNAGADPNAANNTGNTPVHLAAWRGRDYVMYHLICTHDGDPLSPNKDGDSAVHIATRFRYPRVLALIEDELKDRAFAGQAKPLPEPIKLPGEE